MKYLQDDRNGHLYGRHVVAAIKQVRALAVRGEGGYDMREVMASFVGKLSFREMCVVLKEQKGWRQARDFFDWMKLQVCCLLSWYFLEFSLGKFESLWLNLVFFIWVFVIFWILYRLIMGWSKIALNMFNAKLFPSNIWVLLFLFLIHFLEVGLSGVYCYGQKLV